MNEYEQPPIDRALLLENRELHRRGYFGGLALVPHLSLIAKLATKYKAQTILDFGSGKGEGWTEQPLPRGLRGVAVTLYDPAVREHTELPDATFDGVVCTDVLEHIPERDMASTLRCIEQRARYFVVLSICTRAGTKLLPFSGKDVHVTVRPEQWWNEQIARHCSRGGLQVVVRYMQ